MRHITSLLLILLLLVTSAFGEATEYRPKNVSTILCGTFLDTTTVKALTVGAGTVTCSYASHTSGANESAMASLVGAAAVGAVGQFCVPITNTVLNLDGWVRVYCTSSVAGSASFEQKLTTIKSDIATNGVGPLSVTFDGATLGEGVNTIDLSAGYISVDNQYVGDKIALYTSAGKYYASSCITASTDVNERVTTEDNLQALHTTGDFFVIRPDAGCTLTSVKLKSSAISAGVAGLLATSVNELTALPTDGTETLQTLWRAVYQRFYHKVVDNTVQQERQMFRSGGVVKWCEAALTASGGVWTTGTCGTPD